MPTAAPPARMRAGGIATHTAPALCVGDQADVGPGMEDFRLGETAGSGPGHSRPGRRFVLAASPGLAPLEAADVAAKCARAWLWVGAARTLKLAGKARLTNNVDRERSSGKSLAGFIGARADRALSDAAGGWRLSADALSATSGRADNCPPKLKSLQFQDFVKFLVDSSSTVFAAQAETTPSQARSAGAAARRALH